ncbi:hypothetical protein EV175_006721, partial [Coemansia sp. RSA 1933]
MSNKGNPILPSEPLSLQPNLIAAAVLAEGAEQPSDDSHGQLSPRSASKVQRRMDIRHYGRSESREPLEERGGRYRGNGRSPDDTAAAEPSPDHQMYQQHGYRGRGGGYHGSQDDYEAGLSPRDRSAVDHRFDRRERRSYSPRHMDRDVKRFRIAGAADGMADNGAEAMQSSYYASNRSNDDGAK